MRYARIATPIISILFELAFFQSSFAFQVSVPFFHHASVTVLSPTTVKFQAVFSPADPGNSYWFDWDLKGSMPVTHRISATMDTVIDGKQYVSAFVNSLTPDTMYYFEARATSTSHEEVTWQLYFTTNHSSLDQFKVTSVPDNSCDLLATCESIQHRSVLTVTSLSSFNDISTDTIEAGTGEISLFHHVSNLTPSSVYAFRASIRTIDGPFSTSEAVGSAMTPYDSIARGVLAPLYLSEPGSPLSYTNVLNFGVHTSGSSCLDPMLGEYDLPPWPPSGPEMRIIGQCLNLGLYHDFHLYYSPAQVDTYRIRFQTLNDTYPMHLSWPELDSLYSGPVTLVTSDTTLDMKSVNEYSIENPDIAVLRIIAAGPMPRPYRPIIADMCTTMESNFPDLSSFIITNGLPTEAWFEWGTTPSYGNETPHQTNAGGAMLMHLIGYPPSFGADTVYYMRSVAKNSHGTYFGQPQSVHISVTNVRSAPELPTKFELYQNYPNPFNPATLLRYTLPMESKVELTIFNMLGQVVANLADDVEQSGYKSVEWNAGDVASGLYFYRLAATSVADPSKTFTQVRKMLFVK